MRYEPMHSSAHLAHDAAFGGYRPVTQEYEAFDPKVIGKLPDELDGTFLCIGPNPLPESKATGHAFAHDAMVHGIRIRDGRAAWYRNRWVRTQRVCRARGGLPTPGPSHGLFDNPNCNIIRLAGRTLALGDGGVLPVELDENLDTSARVDLDGTLPGCFSSHPVLDPLTGELHAVAYRPDRAHIDYLIVDAGGRVRSAEPINVKNTPMMHAFSLTARHAILYDLPVTFDERAADTGSRMPYSWDSGHGARLGIMPREGTDADVLWMDIEPCYVFHPVNAYDVDGGVVIDVIRHERVFDRDRRWPRESAPALWRWRVDTAAGTVIEEQLDEFVEEFPGIDGRYVGTRHRFAFATGLESNSPGALAGPVLLQHDLVAGRTRMHGFGAGRETGEAVFVPRSACAPEADGWLMSLVYDKATDRSELVVLDTEDFTGPPVAVVQLPTRVPHGFHAAWFAAS